MCKMLEKMFVALVAAAAVLFVAGEAKASYGVAVGDPCVSQVSAFTFSRPVYNQVQVAAAYLPFQVQALPPVAVAAPADPCVPVATAPAPADPCPPAATVTVAAPAPVYSSQLFGVGHYGATFGVGHYGATFGVGHNFGFGHVHSARFGVFGAPPVVAAAPGVTVVEKRGLFGLLRSRTTIVNGPPVATNFGVAAPGVTVVEKRGRFGGFLGFRGGFRRHR